MIYAESREAVDKARIAFARKWKLRCKAVVSSLEEAGDELFTFLGFPTSSGSRCARPTRSSESTRSSVKGR